MFCARQSRMVIWLILILVASPGLAACGDVTPTPVPLAPTATKAAQAVTLRWSYWGSDAEVAINKKIATQFESLNPGVKIEHVFVPFEQYFDKLTSEWNGPKAPILSIEYHSHYASLGLIENIEPYVQRDKDRVNLDDIYPNLLNTFRYNGALYGLPRDNDTKVIYYNKKLFDDAKVPYPKQGWNWQDLRNTALKLTKKIRPGMSRNMATRLSLKPGGRQWVYQNGGKLFDDFTPPNPPTKLLLNTPKRRRRSSSGPI